MNYRTKTFLVALAALVLSVSLPAAAPAQDQDQPGGDPASGPAGQPVDRPGYPKPARKPSNLGPGPKKLFGGKAGAAKVPSSVTAPVQQAVSSPPPPPVQPEPPQPDGSARGPEGSKAGIIEVSAHSDCPKAKAKGPFKLDFQKAEILDVVKFISELTCKNFIIPDSLRQGKITIMSPQSVTIDEAYQAFLSALEVNKLTIVPAGKYFKLMGQRDSISATIPLLTEGQNAPKDDQMITKVIKLRFVDANTLTPTLKQLASKDGDIFTYQPTNTIIISDTGNNMFRLEQIIKQLDVAGSEDEIHLIQINYALASAVAEKLIAIFDVKAGQKSTTPPLKVMQPGRPPAPPPSRTPGQGAPEGGAEAKVSKILFDERTNKVIVIGNRESMQEIMELIKKLDVPVADAGQVHVHYLENADAEHVATTLSQLSQGKATSGAPPKAGAHAGRAGAMSAELFSGDIKVTADKTTNSLVIISNAADYRSLISVIKKLDVRRRQVFVEAVILEVTLDKTRDLGVALSGGTGVPVGGGQMAPVFGGTVLGGLNSILMDPTSLASMGGLIAGIQGPAVEGVTLGNSKITIPSFGAVLRALESSSDVNVLSTPNLLTTDNEEAEILVGQNIPYQAGFTTAVSGSTGISTFNPIVSINRMDVAIKMKIKPQINHSDYVKLNIEEEVSDVAGTDPILGPTTSKRSTKTVVVVRDQQTVATGGLIKDNETINVSKVPFFGDIPVIGWLFKTKKTKTTKTNLLLFLTPYIIRDQEDFRRIFERKMRERQEFVERFYGTSKEFQVFIDYERKHGPAHEMFDTISDEMKKFENGGDGASGETAVTPEGVIETSEMDTASVKTTRQDEVKEAQPGQPAQEAPAGMSRINVPGMVQPRGEAPKPPDQGDTQAPPAPPSPPEERLEVR